MQVTFGANINFKVVGNPTNAANASSMIQGTIKNAPYLTGFKNYKFDSTKQLGSFQIDDSLIESLKTIMKRNIPKNTDTKINVRVINKKK